jgi:hypothetical protein
MVSAMCARACLPRPTRTSKLPTRLIFLLAVAHQTRALFLLEQLGIMYHQCLYITCTRSVLLSDSHTRELVP